MQQPGLTIASGILTLTGLALLGFYATSRVTTASEHQQGLEDFAAAREAHQETILLAQSSNTPGDVSAQIDASDFVAASAASPSLSVSALAVPDKSDWSDKRIADYDAVLAEGHDDMPEGIMRIPVINLELPVYTGTEERNLTRGAGRIEGTPPIATGGNSGIAAHRDGYFRALKDVKLGDNIHVETFYGEHTYEIVDLFIVEPSDVHVLAPTDADSITLVTCYPFYFVGNAPQRYIVRAELRGS